ncbi:DUF3048 domain-containing protein [Sulfobacillus thermosulfidooxidans]|uniref:DUF3048 domain-containing protein n=1 Tax=Sulfobacillus thermosulfidooxidans TaxID=28034 RepID=UPI0009FB30E4|nr:DUF3048 domain-containing protein [Sulfobacillus thermosulfidooxidans]
MMHWNSKHFVILGSALLLAGCGIAKTSPRSHTSAPSSVNSTSPSPASSKNLDPLTGLPSSHHGPLLAVMVENSEYGRPQYGLRSADVVYEAYTEFFYYSRFMLLFYGKEPAQVGPVRSARPYFVSWVHEWPGAAYVHAGASDPGYVSINQDHIHNLDVDANAYGLAYRVNYRPAPHNLFVSIPQAAQMAQASWGNPGIRPHWQFGPKTGKTPPRYQTITLTWNTHNTIEQWRWDEQQRGWTRWVLCPECPDNQYVQVMGENSHKPVLASNIIIQYTQEEYLPDPAHTGWIQIQTHGQGKALLILGNHIYRGTWRNQGPGMPTKFYLNNGEPAKFAPGQTWIEVVPNSQSAANPFQLQLQ